MVVPLSAPMNAKDLILRVYSVRRAADSTFEVRAETEECPSVDDPDPIRIASLFYLERRAHNLPPVDSLIRVTIREGPIPDDPLPAEVYRDGVPVSSNTTDAVPPVTPTE